MRLPTLPTLPTKKELKEFALKHKNDIAAATSIGSFVTIAAMATVDPERFGKTAHMFAEMLGLNSLSDPARLALLGTMAVGAGKAGMDAGKRLYAFVRPPVVDPATVRLINQEEGRVSRTPSIEPSK